VSASGGGFNLEQFLIGESRTMCELRALIERIAPTALTVLIRGQTGVGKELVAQALHALSGRGGRFVPVNVAAVPDTMFEDEFFGHVRGAFTGAISDRPGLLTEAHRGTLFLDEVGSFSLAAQPKLLRVLETRIFRPVGARADHRSEFRILAATNENFDALIAAERFRRDLRRRLSEVVIHVPPLSERHGDIELLARHFAQRVDGAHEIVVTPDAMCVLEAYDWPDNVRELRQTVECGLALGDGVRLTASNVRAALGARVGPTPMASGMAIALPRWQLVRLLEECDWDTARVAARLDVHRSTIYRRMCRLGVHLRDRNISRGGAHSHHSHSAHANSRHARANDANDETVQAEISG
jgi:two-component system, repressor protein LuxO